MRFPNRHELNCIGLATMLVAPLSNVAFTEARAGTQPYVGEMMLVAFDWCPRGWDRADGTTVSAGVYPALRDKLGTSYGGAGSSYKLPDLRGRVPMHVDPTGGAHTKQVGASFGVPELKLTIDEMPTHGHSMAAVRWPATQTDPTGNFLAKRQAADLYHSGPPEKTMDTSMIAAAGASKPINMYQPSLGMTWCIAVEGIAFPDN